jgi:hypothetical protein
VPPELARRNMRLGFVLLALSLALFAGSIAVAVIYDALS